MINRCKLFRRLAQEPQISLHWPPLHFSSFRESLSRCFLPLSYELPMDSWSPRSFRVFRASSQDNFSAEIPGDRQGFDFPEACYGTLQPFRSAFGDASHISGRSEEKKYYFEPFWRPPPSFGYIRSVMCVSRHSSVGLKSHCWRNLRLK